MFIMKSQVLRLTRNKMKKSAIDVANMNMFKLHSIARDITFKLRRPGWFCDV